MFVSSCLKKFACVAATSTAVGATSLAVAAPTVDGLVIMNVKYKNLVGAVTNGAVIDMQQIPGKRIAIQALTTPGVVDKVKFNTDGVSRTDRSFPYTATGEKRSGTLKTFPCIEGTHTVKARAYLTESGVQVKTPYTKVSFSMINCPK